MHHELKIPPDQTVYYRYNPQADVLAVRFAAQFEPGEESPLPDMPEVSLTRDSQSGACVGLRIAGVQQLILSALVRDVLAQARPELEAAGALARAEVVIDPGVARMPSPALQPSEPAPPAAAPAAPSVPEAGMTTLPDAEPPSARVARSEAVQADSAPMIEAVSDPAVSDPDAGEAASEADEDGKPRRKRRRRRRRGKTSGDAEGAVATPGAAAAASALQPDSAAAPARAPKTAPAPPAGSESDRGEVARAVAAVAAAMGAGRAAGTRRPSEPAAATDAPAGAAPMAPQEPLDVPVATDDAVATFGAPAIAPAPAPAEPSLAPPAAAAVEPPVEPERAAYDASRQADAGAASEPVEASMAPHPVPAQPPAPAPVPAPPPAVPAASLPLAAGFAALGLHPSIGEAIAGMGFDTPTPIQVQAIPVAMTGRDVIGLAQTGTGKTLAFVAPALHRILASRRADEHLPGLLVLAPTRELTVQVAEEAERLSARSGLRVATIYGGVGMGPQIDALKGGVDVIVATPGRMLDHLRRGNVKIGSVQTLVLDEADRMLDMGFLPDVRTILRFLGEDRQTLFFTATMPPEIESLSLEFQHEPVVVEIARRKPPEAIDQLLYPIGKHLKAPLLVHLLKSDPGMKSVLVFTERKIDADVLASRLRQEGLKVALMHGDRRQQDREKALEDLASGKVQVLVATNVAARGLDIDDISHVVNYDIPQTVDEYVHRIGRTARAEAEGSAWTLVTVSDEMMVGRIESALGRKLPRVLDETFDYDVPTPSWAKPSAKDVLAMLNKSQSVADRMRHLGRRR